MGAGGRGGRVGPAACGLGLLAAELRWHEEVDTKLERAKITAAGCQFRFPDSESALRHVLDQEPVT